MAQFVDNIETITKSNTNFRQVITTNQHSQLVVMSLKPGEDIGMEVHPDIDQFLRIESGQGEVSLNGEITHVQSEWAIVVPAGTEHNLTNTSDQDLKLYTVYSPPEHPDGTIHQTKQEAMDAEHH